VSDVLSTLRDRGDTIANPAGFVVRLLADRYGDADTVTAAAEGLFMSLRIDDGRPLVSWKKAQEITRRYGAENVSNVLREMHQRDNILNPVGYLVASLKRGMATSTKQSQEDTVTDLVQTIRALAPDRAMTRKKATELIRNYGIHAVTRALRLLKSRKEVDNPAGFVISVLRSEVKSRAAASHT
jgi:hypothetical protein